MEQISIVTAVPQRPPEDGVMMGGSGPGKYTLKPESGEVAFSPRSIQCMLCGMEGVVINLLNISVFVGKMKIVPSIASISRDWVWWLMPATSTQEAMPGRFRIKASYRVRVYFN